MKKFIMVAVIASLVMTMLTGCGQNDQSGQNEQNEQGEQNTPSGGDSTELVIFAAASLTETLNAIAEQYGKIKPDTTLVFNFDSSGTLKTQIEEGANCDLFISAAQKQMDELEAEYVLDGTRINLLKNKVALAVPEGNPTGITSFDGMIEALSSGNAVMAMGNEDVPVGQYTKKILEYYGVDEATLTAANAISYASNVKEATTQVSEATVDCGVIYSTDAFSAGLTVVDTATEEMCGQVIYPAAVLKNSGNAEAAKEFLEYLRGEAAMTVFESVGFSEVK